MKETRASRPRPASAPSSAAGSGAGSAFIVGAVPDLALMVGAPAWVLPLLLLAAAATTERGVNEAVAALGAIGHHLPGMLRAYGDRALFHRFRRRFVLAPLVLGGLCLLSAHSEVHPIVLIAFVWGIWHGLAQSYGFARIYGAKAGAGDRASARADRALLLAWFATAIVHSPLRLFYLLDLLATCGLPLPSAAALAAVRLTMDVGTLLVTAAWLLVVVIGARAGRGPGAVRLLLLASSIGAWWFAYVRVQHLLLAAPLFEVFHDVQYLTIVWIYNRRRVEQAGGALSPALRVLFEPTAAAVGLYLVAVLGYGALAFLGGVPQVAHTVTGLVAASQLLHFYYDGFIWRVREADTGGVLGVSSGAAAARAPAAPWRGQALLWAAIVVPYLGLWYGERTAGAAADRAIAIAELVPDNALGRFTAAELLWAAGQRERALSGFRAALLLDPAQGGARRNLALSLCELADEAQGSGQRDRLRALGRELLTLRAGLAPGDLAFVDRRLAAYAASLTASR